MDGTTDFADRKRLLESRIAAVTDQVRQLEPIALEGQQAQERIDVLAEELSMLEEELGHIHDVLAARGLFVRKQGFRFKDMKERRPC